VVFALAPVLVFKAWATDDDYFDVGRTIATVSLVEVEEYLQ